MRQGSSFHSEARANFQRSEAAALDFFGNLRQKIDYDCIYSIKHCLYTHGSICDVYKFPRKMKIMKYYENEMLMKLLLFLQFIRDVLEVIGVPMCLFQCHRCC